MIGIVSGVVVLWCLLSLPIGLLLGRSLSIGTKVETMRRRVASSRIGLTAPRGLQKLI